MLILLSPIGRLRFALPALSTSKADRYVPVQPQQWLFPVSDPLQLVAIELAVAFVMYQDVAVDLFLLDLLPVPMLFGLVHTLQGHVLALSVTHPLYTLIFWS